MAIYYTPEAKYIQAASSGLTNLFNGGEWKSNEFKTSTIEPGYVVTQMGVVELLTDLSTACKITKIILSGECRAYKGDIYGSMHVVFKAKGQYNKQDLEPYKQFHDRYCSADSWGSFTVETAISPRSFIGFAFQKAGEGYCTINRTAQLRNVKMTYTRTRACYITFSGDGIETKKTEYDYGASVSYGSIPTRSGYNFKGWNDGTTTYTGTLPVAGEFDKEYTAVWEKQPPYTLYYDTNGADKASYSISQEYSTSFYLPASNEIRKSIVVNFGKFGVEDSIDGDTKTSYSFYIGWEDLGTITASDNKQYSPEEFDAPFYANKYSDLLKAFGYNKQNLVNHWVNSGKNEGRTCIGETRGLYPPGVEVCGLADQGGTTTLKARFGDYSAITLPVPASDLRTKGYLFLGWYTNDGTRVGGIGDSYTPKEDIKLYSKWQPKALYYENKQVNSVYVDGQKVKAIYFETTKIYE